MMTHRLITAGTIEEKMYQRQVFFSRMLSFKNATKCIKVMKSGLSVGEGEVVSGHFSKEELRDLFSFREDTDCETHDLLQCSCGGGGQPQKVEQVEVDRNITISIFALNHF